MRPNIIDQFGRWAGDDPHVRGVYVTDGRKPFVMRNSLRSFMDRHRSATYDHAHRALRLKSGAVLYLVSCPTEGDLHRLRGMEFSWMSYPAHYGFFCQTRLRGERTCATAWTDEAQG